MMNISINKEVTFLGSGFLKDLGLLAVLFAFNPIFIYFSMSFDGVYPDSILYFYFSETLLQDAMLFVSSWGHVDTAIILPPLYPFVLAILELIHPNQIISNAEMISSTSMLLAVIPLYYSILMLSNRVFSFLLIVCLQFNYYYLYFGFTSLTEGLFILLICSSVCLAIKILFYSASNNKFGYFFLGILAALVFFTRQIGLVFFIFMILWFAIEIFLSTKNIRKQRVLASVAFICGFLFLILPYSISLYMQTGHSLLTQSYRLNNYQVNVEEDALNKELESIPVLSGSEYENIYRRRRQLFTLLPDSSEMLSYVYKDSETEIDNNGLVTDIKKLLFQNTTGISGFGINVYNNVKFISIPLGGALATLLLLSYLSLLYKSNGSTRRNRLLVPGFVATYMVFISILAGSIDRYVLVLFPLVLVHIATEGYTIILALNTFIQSSSVLQTYPILKEKNLPQIIYSTLGIAVVILIINFPPLTYGNLRFPWPKKPLFGEVNLPYINNKEPIFATEAFDPVRFGGLYRTLPNDSLEKVVQYAHLTGVRFLIINNSAPHLELYNKAGWLQQDRPIESDLITLRYQSRASYLYEIN